MSAAVWNKLSSRRTFFSSTLKITVVFYYIIYETLNYSNMNYNEINSIDDLNSVVASGEVTSPLKAIRLKCLDCSAYDRGEVRNCFVEKCPLFPFRLGRNPFRKTREYSEEERAALGERLRKAREEAQNG